MTTAGPPRMPKRSRQIIFPEAESPFLNKAIASFKKRARAIRYAGGDITIQRVVERDGTEDIEKIEIHLKGSLGPQVTLSLWGDRWIFVHAGHLTKHGWLWEWTKQGRFVPTESEREIVQNSEKMLEAGLCSGKPKQFCETLWKPVIATGPSIV